MPGHRPQETRRAGSDIRRLPQRIDVADVQPPGEERDEGSARLGRQRRPLEVPEQRDPARAGVEAARVRSHDVSLDTADPPFERLSERVDDEVVADVVPAVRLDVVELDRTDERRRVVGCGRGLSGRVVDDRKEKPVGVVRIGPNDRLVCTPVCAGLDERGGHGRQPS